MKNKFQKTFLAFAFLLVANFVMAQAPQGIPYQAVARDNAGNLIKNQNIALRFSIHDGTANGAVVFSETHSVTTDALGLFSVNIGGGNSSGTFANINWGSGAKFTQVALDVTGGSNYTDMGTTQMMSVPYALYAGSSGNSSSVSTGAIGQNSSSNGATITNGVLSLTPADATNGGIVTNGTQTFAGTKTFNAQLGVGTSSPNNTAALDITSTTQGFLPPRMTYTQRKLITNPTTGLVLFCTDCGIASVGGELQVYSGGMWRNMIGSASAGAYPTVASTTTATNITGTTTTSGGNITNDGGSAIIARGVCWSTSQNPTIADSKTSDAGTTGTYTSSLRGLSSMTTYYLRAYATNAFGTSYGAQINFTTNTLLAIGDSYGGGIVAYILQQGNPGYDANVQHGLIAAPSDQSTGAQWGCYGTTIAGADGTAFGTGNQNTIDIMNGCNTLGIAARICGDLVLNNYSDWYLPSYDEIQKLYLNRTVIGIIVDNYYWTSSDDSKDHALRFSFFNGNGGQYSKYQPAYVRAVRAF